jgi:protoheme IX farnesyltransferase
MKATLQTLDASTPLVKTASAEKPLAAVLCDLFKARLTALVLLTTWAGFYLGSRPSLSWVLMLNALTGTALLAAGASALNQLLEREYDAKMRRTRGRPLPSGRLTAETVLKTGASCASLGLLWLAVTVNWITTLLGALTLCIYLLIYTPLKHATTLNTVVGAIPGALPPLMGWTAATGSVSVEGWSLFAILGFWQLPHFLAIAWMYRDEYAKAGFVMLPVVDPTGEKTGRQALSHTLGLLAVSVCPFLFGMAGPVYLAGAILFGAAFLWCAFDFSRRLTLQRARLLFFASIVYLPSLLGLMVLDKT